MKKKLLALAVAGAFVAPVAMADTANVTIYGQAGVSFDSVDNGSSGGNTGNTNSKISSNGSHIGFKGAESLGGGTSAIWQIESSVFIDNSGAGGQGFGTRNTFAGLGGEGWGSIKLGRIDTPYKTATRNLDMFDETIADNRSLMGAPAPLPNASGSSMKGFDTRMSDQIMYTSPSMSGFSISGSYIAGAENKTGTGTKGSAYSLAGAYDVGPIYATLAYQNNKIGAPCNCVMSGIPGVVDNTESAWKVGGAYRMDQFQVALVYEKTRDDFAKGTGNEDVNGHHAWYLGGKFNFTGSDAVKLAYTKANELNSPALKSNSGAKQVSIGYDHAMSKRTTIYALYTKLDNDSQVRYGLATDPGIEASGATTASGPGADPRAFSLGMKHTF